VAGIRPPKATLAASATNLVLMVKWLPPYLRFLIPLSFVFVDWLHLYPGAGSAAKVPIPRVLLNVCFGMGALAKVTSAR